MHRQKQGFSLLEVMFSTVILAALAIGGSASLRYAGATIQQQQSRRNAVAVASSVMEQSLHEVGLTTLNANAEEEEMNSVQTISRNGKEYQVTRTVTSDGDDTVWIRVTVESATTEPFTICFQGLAQS